MSTKVGFISLGCPKNQVDCEVMIKHVADAGYEIVADDIDADIIIVNTCAFIESAKKESIDNILDVAWLKENRHLRGIIVTGCLAERYRDEVLAELPEVDAVVGCGGIHGIADIVRQVDAGTKKTFYPPIEALRLGGDRVVTTPPHYAYLKISEGCNNRCTYCAIPYIRGAYRSRPQDDIVREAVELEEMGAKEIVLIAQDTTRYGEDLGPLFTLTTLIDAIINATKSVKLRLLYCYPDMITDELTEKIRTCDRVIKYIDLPIQHISDNVLRRMGRRGGSECIRTAIKKLRSAVPDIVIRTTLITGFPGETEEDYAELCDFVAETRFVHLGVFPYSREEGTPAYDFPDQIDENVKNERADGIMKTQLIIRSEWAQSFIGKTLEVVTDGFDPVSECYYGRSFMDAPDIDGKVYFTAPKGIKEGQTVNVKITEVIDYDLLGEKE